MSRKHADLERELIEDLEPRTGRSLAQWMAAIDAACLADKNAIIDWLRPQGLTFAHASWLERIHNNGGRPIYLDGAATPDSKATAPPPAAAAPLPPALPPPSPPRPTGVHTSPTARPAPLPVPRPAASASSPAESLAGLMERGKGLRPLAEMLVREILAAVPGAMARPAGDLVSLVRTVELAVLLIGPRELRLGLALGDAAVDGMLARARVPGAGPHITHMVVVNDARQIAPPLLDLVRRAATRAGG